MCGLLGCWVLDSEMGSIRDPWSRGLCEYIGGEYECKRVTMQVIKKNSRGVGEGASEDTIVLSCEYIEQTGGSQLAVAVLGLDEQIYWFTVTGTLFDRLTSYRRLYELLVIY